MNKQRMILPLIVIIGILGAAYFFSKVDSSTQSSTDETAVSQSNKTRSNDNVDTFNKEAYSIDEPGSIWLIANKNRPLGGTYKPDDLRSVAVAKRTDKSDEELMLRDQSAKALEALFVGAKADGVDLLLGSAYRSYALQKQYYESYVASYGQAEADRFSARPGTSEHQTGLAADISGADRVCYLEICFSEQPAGKWLAKNAHEYGFIIRYLDGKESVTGYQYEPWHIRFVGTELATQLYKSKQTMEEFFNL